MADDPKAEGTANSRTLKRAADLSGGVAALARLLHVKAADLEQWIAGAPRPPADVFLAALDIVSGASVEQRARDSQNYAAKPADNERLRKINPQEQKPASNQPADSKRKPEGAK